MIPVLDKGYVALLDTSLSMKRIRSLLSQSVSANMLLPHVVLTFKIKCPILVRLRFSEYGIATTSIPMSAKQMETYKPTLIDVESPDLEQSVKISQEIEKINDFLMSRIKNTSDPLELINAPISLYNIIVASAPLEVWRKFTVNIEPHTLIQPYQRAINDLVLADYAEVLQDEEAIGEKDPHTPDL